MVTNLSAFIKALSNRVVPMNFIIEQPIKHYDIFLFLRKLFEFPEI